MKKSTILTALLLIAISTQLHAQAVNTTPKFDQSSLGVGLGLDYGGIGVNYTVFPSQNVGLFGGAGFALAGVGYNVGVKLRSVPKKANQMTCFYGLAMYGYNAAIAITNKTSLNKLFYGPTIGVGFDLRSHPYTKNSYWSFALLIPIRSAEVDQYIDDLKNYQGVEFKNNLFPIAISVGYRFGY